MNNASSLPLAAPARRARAGKSASRAAGEDEEGDEEGKAALKRNPPKKTRGNLPKAATAVLRQWLALNVVHAYPPEEVKEKLAEQLNLSVNQICNWFINARRRLITTVDGVPRMVTKA